MAVIDFHTHVLPAIDDGSKDVKMSLEMLLEEKEQGVDIVVATPHFYASSDTPSHFFSKRAQAYDKVMQNRFKGMPKILLGAEVAFFAGIGKADGVERFCIGDTNVMLLEMPFCPWSSSVLREVQMLCDRGIQLIIAHYERFYKYQKSSRPMEELLDFPVYIQINAESLIERKNRRKALSLFKNGDAQLLGSDSHNLDRRPVNIGEGREELEHRFGSDFLWEMDDIGSEILNL